MGRRRTIEVEIDLTDLSDDDLRDEARARGLNFDGDPIVVSDLAFAITNEKPALAIHYLDSLVAHSPGLRHAVEIGRRRVR